MNLLRLKGINPTQLLLRLGLATVFLYAAISGTLNPREWVGYLPALLTDHFDAELLLQFFSVYEFALAVLLLSGLYIRYVALLCTLTLVGIVISNASLLAVSFRDVGLAFASLALAFTDPKTPLNRVKRSRKQ